MTCGHCVAAVTAELSELAPDASIEVVLGSRRPVDRDGGRGRPAHRRAGRGRSRRGRRLHAAHRRRRMTSPTTVDLSIEGMTCASCAMRIEKKLNKVPGVQATVNYATEKAHVLLPADVSVDDAIAVVEATGYHARCAAGRARRRRRRRRDPELAALRSRLVVSTVLTVPVVLMAMMPVPPVHLLAVGLAHAGGARGGLGRAALPPRRVDQPAARRRHDGHPHLASACSPPSCWSLYALFLGGAGEPGMTHVVPAAAARRRAASRRSTSRSPPAVTVFILLGRYLEARAKAGPARRCGCSPRLGAKDVAVVRDGVERRIPIEQLAVGDVFVVRPGEKIATDGTVVEGSSAVDNSLVHGRDGARRGRRSAIAVIGATVNAGGRILVEATVVGADTQLARIARMVEQAQDGQGPRAAARRPRVGGVRPHRHRPVPRDPRRLAAHRRRRAAGVHRRGRRPDHRLPVRARTGDADRAHGGHRARCAARHPHQGPADPGVDAAGRHDRARQDRHRHDRPHDSRPRTPRRGNERGRSGDAGRRAGGRVRASRRPGRRRRRPEPRRHAAGRRRIRRHPWPRRPGGRRRACRPRRASGLAARRVVGRRAGTARRAATSARVLRAHRHRCRGGRPLRRRPRRRRRRQARQCGGHHRS